MPDMVVAAKSPLIDLSAAEAVTAIRRGDLSAERYARALLDRCTQLRDLNAFIALDCDAVLEAAQKLDKHRSRGRPLGALAGLPIPLKDIIGTTTLPMTCGTRSLRSFRLKEDTTHHPPEVRHDRVARQCQTKSVRGTGETLSRCACAQRRGINSRMSARS